MNRLIIIGNGFDIAHGLKTKYSDFLEYYWSQVKFSYSDKLIDFQTKLKTKICFSLDEIIEIQKIANKYQNNVVEFKIKNIFFHDLNKNCKTDKWVDIEMFYYEKLKAKFLLGDFKGIKKLNDNFEDVKYEFEKYIQHVVNNSETISDLYMDEIADIFSPICKGQKYNENFSRKLTYKVLEIIDKRIESMHNTNFDLYSIVHILNFNYTDTVNYYETVLEKNESYHINNIHGEAGKNIVFGFGDERDEIFSKLEDKNINEFLRFMKSSFYLQNSKYYDLLNFIESENYVVEIYGHSCGLSDRTLLKTIFEHKNCLQIFLSYYRESDTKDNFFDLSLNISRHFDDKIMLRRKVANKEFSIPLPQRKSKE